MIEFGIWAPSEDVFWASWVGAGICTERLIYAPGYAGCIETSYTWSGHAMRNGVSVPGWHTNVKVIGALAQMFTAGCPDVGTIWERTHAAQAFGLVQQDADPVTGFPAGMRSQNGVTYADLSAFSSPSNTWA